MTVYKICVIGQVDADWSEWFDGLTISNTQSGEAMIFGDIVDQAALHGTLNKIRDLNLALISVIKVDSGLIEPVPLLDFNSASLTRSPQRLQMLRRSS